MRMVEHTGRGGGERGCDRVAIESTDGTKFWLGERGGWMGKENRTGKPSCTKRHLNLSEQFLFLLFKVLVEPL